MSESALIKLVNIKKTFFTDEVETNALSDINLEINKGEYVAFAGASGCGKSTLLSILGLLDTSTDGNYQLAGTDVSDIDRDLRAQIRNKEIGFVFQSFNLISDLTVEENVALPLTYRSDLNKKQISEMVDFALDKVEMSHRKKHFPSQLSGGQQQRIAVARALAGRPSLILADEPTGNLDSKNAEMVMQLLEQLHKDGSTICMVTHDEGHSKRALRRVELFDGKIISDTLNNQSAA